MNYEIKLNPDFLECISEVVNGNDILYKKYRNKGGSYSWSLLNANIIRIRDVVAYLASDRMKISTDDFFSNYVFSDWLIYADHMRDLVLRMFKFFDVPNKYKSNYGVFFGNSNMYLYSETIDENDDEFIKYLRSLGGIHPLNTNRYKNKGYQNSMEYSPFIASPRPRLSNLIAQTNQMIKYKAEEYPIEEQFSITVYSSKYRSDEELSEEEKNILKMQKQVKLGKTNY